MAFGQHQWGRRGGDQKEERKSEERRVTRCREKPAKGSSVSKRWGSLGPPYWRSWVEGLASFDTPVLETQGLKIDGLPPSQHPLLLDTQIFNILQEVKPNVEKFIVTAFFYWSLHDTYFGCIWARWVKLSKVFRLYDQRRRKLCAGTIFFGSPQTVYSSWLASCEELEHNRNFSFSHRRFLGFAIFYTPVYMYHSLYSHAQGLGLTPCWGTKIPQVTCCSQKKKKSSFLFLKLRYNWHTTLVSGIQCT